MDDNILYVIIFMAIMVFIILYLLMNTMSQPPTQTSLPPIQPTQTPSVIYQTPSVVYDHGPLYGPRFRSRRWWRR
jgi:hypothetical protein